MDEDTICGNLEMILSTDAGGLMKAIENETIGGQFGDHDGVPCSNVPFFYDMQTGALVWFGSHEEVPAHIANEYSVGLVRIAQSKTESKIIEATARLASPEARANIQEAVERYNKTQRTA